MKLSLILATAIALPQRSPSELTEQQEALQALKAINEMNHLISHRQKSLSAQSEFTEQQEAKQALQAINEMNHLVHSYALEVARTGK